MRGGHCHRVAMSHITKMPPTIRALAEDARRVGRNGMHKYNNQDHSLLCANNAIAGERRFDLWWVNEDAEYHEAGAHGSGSSMLRQVPKLAAAVSGGSA